MYAHPISEVVLLCVSEMLLTFHLCFRRDKIENAEKSQQELSIVASGFLSHK